MPWFERLEYKWNRATKRQQTLAYVGVYTIVFLIGFLIAWSPFLKAGKTFVWQEDGRGQHYPYMVYIGRYLRRILLDAINGKLSIPLFDLNMSSGDDVIGFLNGQGATDPLLFFSVFVPTKYSEHSYAFLAIFRVYLSGLSFLFLCSYFKKNKIHSLIGSIIYCFSGYALVCSMRHPYFVNPMIILPLLIVGTDKIVKKDYPYTFIFAMFYGALCGYYLLYMMTIIVGIYAIIRFFDLNKVERIKNLVFVGAKGIFSYCLGIGFAAIIFFPGIAEFLNAGRSEFSNYNGSYAWAYYRTRLLRLIAPPGSWDDMAFAAIVLFALVLLFFSRHRRSLKFLTIFAFAIYLTSIGGLVMNGFQYSSNRWTYGLVLVVSFVVVEMLPELLEISGKQQLICMVVLCIYTFAALSTPTTRKLTYVLVGITFLSLTAMVLVMRIQWIGPLRLYDGRTATITHWRKTMRTFLCFILVFANVMVNGLYKFAADQGNYSSEFAKSGYEVERLENITEREMEPYLLNNPVGRVDSSSSQLNTAMVWRIPGLLYYSSIANGNVLNFWKEIENVGNSVMFKMYYSDQRTIVNTLLSTMYHVESEENISHVPYGYTAIKKTEVGNVIYKNNYALPWGYTYDNVISYNDLNRMNAIKKQEVMLQAIALENVVENSAINNLQYDDYVLPYEIEYKNCKWEDGKLVVSSANATITLDFTMSPDVEGYVRLVGFDINNSGLSGFSVKVSSENITKSSGVSSNLYTWYWGRENYLFNLGYSDEERTSLTINFPSKGTFQLDDIELYALPMDNYPERVEALRAEPLENIKWDTNKLTGTIELSKDKVLCVSVPYSKGWSAKVDGEKVEILRGNYMFMAIPLTAGHHNIEFSYCSPGLKLGAAVTVISIFILIWMIIHDRRQKKINGSKVS